MDTCWLKENLTKQIPNEQLKKGEENNIDMQDETKVENLNQFSRVDNSNDFEIECDDDIDICIYNLADVINANLRSIKDKTILQNK